MAEPKNLETQSTSQCILLIHGVLGANSGTVNTVVTVAFRRPALHCTALHCTALVLQSLQ